MTLEQKETWIAYIQSLHAEWLIKFENNLKIGSCVEESYKQNILISNLIALLYRVEPNQEHNCLTDEQICDVKNKLLELLKNCKCS
jgi:hypothetical protein